MKKALFLLLVFSAAFAFPKPAGFVNDYAGILPNAQQLEAELSEYEKNTTIEIAVVTLDSLPEDHTMETYAVELFSEWGIGKKDDNGILVLIVKNQTAGKRMRIELGYGIQGYITGAEAGRMLDNALPYYLEGDYQSAAETIIGGLKAQSGAPARHTATGGQDVWTNMIIPSLPFIIPFLFFALGAVFSKERCPYCVSGKITCKGGYCTCQKCGKKFRKKYRRFAFIPMGIGSSHSGGGGFGGFGGGSSGGGGAGRYLQLRCLCHTLTQLQR